MHVFQTAIQRLVVFPVSPSVYDMIRIVFDLCTSRRCCYVRCKWETGLLESEWLNKPEEERDQWKCNGLILFLAELVAQMDESYAFTLGELLVLFITMVLQRPASSSVKYICQALKVSHG